jgi:hypothetical protein
MQVITHRFGVPNRIITDLGTAFTGSAFWDFYQDNTIDVYYSSVAHPRCNSQVERANGMVLQAIKDRIFDDASNYATWWLAELPHVIWGLRTQVSSATGSLPFFLVYGSKAILPTDVAFGASGIQFYEEGEAEQTRHVDLDSLEEQRLAAVMRQARHDQQLSISRSQLGMATGNSPSGIASSSPSLRGEILPVPVPAKAGEEKIFPSPSPCGEKSLSESPSP